MTLSKPAVRFFRRPTGQRIAFATHGSGPPLVCAAWWVSHLEEDWEEENFRLFFSELARHRTVIRYDRWGTGLSDRERDDVRLHEEVSTIAELADHLELPRFDLFAVSCGGPPAIRFTAQNPERVSRLVLFNSFARGTDVGDPNIKDALQGLVRAHWGMGARTITNLFAPDLPKPLVNQLSRQHSKASSAEMAARLLALTFDVDVYEDAERVELPTLVVHRKADRTIQYNAGVEMARTLRNAELCSLEGSAHVPWFGDRERLAKTILEFLGVDSAAVPTVESTENSFHRHGDVWTLSYAGQSVPLKHARGLSDLAMLLQNGGQEVHVSTLWSGAQTSAAVGGVDPILDEEALASYRARYEELNVAIGEAEEGSDPVRVDQLREERDALGRELRTAVGLGGRARGLGDVSERARKAVSARIRSSIKKIQSVHPALGKHLSGCVTTGHHCAYRSPESLVWTVSARD